MKLPPLVAVVAALAWASAAFAQFGAGAPVSPQGGSGSNITSSSGVDIADPLPRYRSAQAQAAYRGVVREYQAACAWDRESLCAAKASEASANRCLTYHRRKLTAGCRTAVDHMELAREGRL
ncbi:MAG: hypothetical protein JSS35_19560 [Proteobacteria bacterium]|nr:hypothetical protein [Pseudomonadota bacterium]